jgi:hypothetical protein
MHSFLTITQRKDHSQLSGVPSGARYGRRFLSCAQREKETPPNFYQMFLQLKAQAPKVSDNQVIAQAIKALRAGPLHSHLVMERAKTMSELYKQFTKFSKSEIQHFRKLE